MYLTLSARQAEVALRDPGKTKEVQKDLKKGTLMISKDIWKVDDIRLQSFFYH